MIGALRWGAMNGLSTVGGDAVTTDGQLVAPSTGGAESVDARIARLGLTDISEARLESLTAAHALGVDDALFRRLAEVRRLGRRETVVIPAHRYEGLSRGKGWARKGSGQNVQWGERDKGGYRVGPGTWTVGGSDGFSRKGSDSWQVEHIDVGGETWTIAR